jgi:hypothetical protein
LINDKKFFDVIRQEQTKRQHSCDNSRTENHRQQLIYGKLKKCIWKKNTIGKNIHYRVMNISHLLLAMLAKIQLKMTY